MSKFYGFAFDIIGGLTIVAIIAEVMRKPNPQNTIEFQLGRLKGQTEILNAVLGNNHE